MIDAYRSIRDQNYYEWIILPNSGAVLPTEIVADSRTRVVGAGFSPKQTDGFTHIGSLKRHLCEHATGDILLELDHDDMLMPGTMDKVIEAFADPNVVLAYSNAADFNNSDKSPRFFGNANKESLYDSVYGWCYQRIEHDGVSYYAHCSPEPSPYHSSLILWAPNHLRAFRRDAYWAVGGHDENLLALDDQDLICRLYLQGEFYHINEGLYLYRVDGNNSWLVKNKWIQDNMKPIQTKYIQRMAEAWADRQGLSKLDLGGRFSSPDGYTSVDLKDADVCMDLNETWAIPDSSVGVIRAFDIIEHLKNPIHTMSEIHRVLVPGGYCFIHVPSTDGRGAWQDPTHVSYWNQNSFFYYTRQQQAKYIDNSSIRFKTITLDTFYPSQWERDNQIPYVRAYLLALKSNIRPMGRVEI
jgi:hypothetical protein